MKYLYLLLLSGSFAMKSHCQYWQQEVHYLIDVQLNDKEKTLDGFEKITYLNHSPDTLHYIWFHVWPNAYKNDKTAFSEQLLQNGNTAFYFSNTEQRGYINRLDFKVDGQTARMEDHPEHIDIIKVLLPKALLPGGKIIISTPFHVKLPFNFSRGGYSAQSIQATQWYPKPAVYDQNGWHPMPYLDQGEFYSEFGNFDVRITVPKDYVVAATGVLQNETEQAWLKTRSNFQLPPAVKPGIANQKKTAKSPTLNATVTKETKTLQFIQDRIHDFAWFADKNFIVQQDTCQLASGKVIQVQSFYTPGEAGLWRKSLQNAKDAVRFYSHEVGEYPYPVVSVVQGPQSFGGGMEYPTITVISPVDDAQELDGVIAHEIGHNWFYGVLASNERAHPWMDEGLNSFYEKKYLQQKYGPSGKEEEITLQTLVQRKRDQPINTASEKFSSLNYGVVAYHKTAEWLRSIEIKVGADAFRRMMQAYFQRWQFKHPKPEDFFAVQQEVLGLNDFSVLEQRGSLAHNTPKGFQAIFPFKKNAFKSYLQNPAKNVLLFSPAIGANTYDKLMVGALFTNYKLPPNKFNFLLIPMYATGSKQFTGLGKLNYSLLTNGFIRKTDFFVNGARFSMDEFSDTANNTFRLHFNKLVPGVRFTFREKDARSTVNRYVQWKTFFFNEGDRRFQRDTIITGQDTALVDKFNTFSTNRFLNQLQVVFENYRALYPFRLTLQVEQAKDFVRPTFTAQYFFNYAKGGGLRARFFAGAFVYTDTKTANRQFENERYHLQMSGPNGYEDYTYSDYFAGRNRFEGYASQQMMVRDGAFKVRTDLYQDRVGRSDEWLLALNLHSTVPDKINPLAVLPIKIPLRVFFDLGTQAGAWKRGAVEERFLFDAGFHLSLLDETINLYIPVIYSSVFGDYYKSTQRSFFNRISFSINLYHKSLRDLNRIAEF